MLPVVIPVGPAKAGRADAAVMAASPANLEARVWEAKELRAAGEGREGLVAKVWSGWTC